MSENKRQRWIRIKPGKSQWLGSLRETASSCPGKKDRVDQQRRPRCIIIIQIAFNENTNSKPSALSTPHPPSGKKIKFQITSSPPPSPLYPRYKCTRESASTLTIRLLASVSTPFTTRFDHGFGSPRRWRNVVLYGIIRTKKLSTNSVSFARARIILMLCAEFSLEFLRRRGWRNLIDEFRCFSCVLRERRTRFEEKKTKNENVPGAVLLLLHYAYIYTRINVHGTSTGSAFFAVKHMDVPIEKHVIKILYSYRSEAAKQRRIRLPRTGHGWNETTVVLEAKKEDCKAARIPVGRGNQNNLLLRTTKTRLYERAVRFDRVFGLNEIDGGHAGRKRKRIERQHRWRTVCENGIKTKTVSSRTRPFGGL